MRMSPCWKPPRVICMNPSKRCSSAEEMTDYGGLQNTIPRCSSTACTWNKHVESPRLFFANSLCFLSVGFLSVLRSLLMCCYYPQIFPKYLMRLPEEVHSFFRRILCILRIHELFKPFSFATVLSCTWSSSVAWNRSLLFRGKGGQVCKRRARVEIDRISSSVYIV